MDCMHMVVRDVVGGAWINISQTKLYGCTQKNRVKLVHFHGKIGLNKNSPGMLYLRIQCNF